MSRMTDAGRFKRGRGDLSKHGRDYLPWIDDREAPGGGTCYRFGSWKDDEGDGSSLVSLSKTEMKVVVTLLWDDRVTEVRTQVPLDPVATNAIADALGVRRVNDGRTVMTTDIVATMADGSLVALSVKPNEGVYGSAEADEAEAMADAEDPTLTPEERKERARARAKRRREREKLAIERAYWEQLGVAFTSAWGDDVDPLFVANVVDATRYWREEDVPQAGGSYDSACYARHLVAHKRLEVDMHGDIDYARLAAGLERRGRCRARGLIEEGKAR